MMLTKVPLYKQKTRFSCGPASLKIVLDYLGSHFSELTLIVLTRVFLRRNEGVSNNDLIRTAKWLGFDVHARSKNTIGSIKYYLNKKLPIIVNYLWRDGTGHYSVVVGMSKGRIILHDTYTGKVDSYSIKSFFQVWRSGDKKTAPRWMMVIEPKKKKKK